MLQYNRESGQTLLRTAATARLRTTQYALPAAFVGRLSCFSFFSFCVEEPSPASANLACGTTAGVSEAADNGVLVSEAGSEAELESVRASDSSSASDDDHIFVQRGVPILQLSSVSRPLSANADSTRAQLIAGHMLAASALCSGLWHQRRVATVPSLDLSSCRALAASIATPGQLLSRCRCRFAIDCCKSLVFSLTLSIRWQID